MDEQVIKIGDPSGLHFDLRWDSEAAAGSGADATDGVLLAWIADHLVWGSAKDEYEGIGWSWISLLEHLAEQWIRLSVEESLPFDVDVWDPLQLRSEAERRWLHLPGTQVEREQGELWAFEHAHDLSRALQGAWTRGLWVVREGRRMWVATNGFRTQQPVEVVLGTLSELGEAISKRLMALTDVRAEKARAAWRGRTARTPLQLVTYSTSLSKELVQAVAGNRSLVEAWGIAGDVLEPNELMAVARMAGPALAPQSIKKIVDRVRSIKVRSNPALDRQSAQAVSSLQVDLGSEPFEQGHKLADWFRDQPGVVTSSGKVIPENVLKEWGVQLLDVDLGDSSIDAVCCWGPRHGPAVLLNPSGRHAQDLGGRRATLAHEIAHLLVDRHGALPLAEVNGGRVSARVEARARAFAAELLLPRRIAGEVISEERDTRTAVQSLCKRYGVSRELVAWQARNSLLPLNQRTFRHLKTLVSEPKRFTPLV